MYKKALFIACMMAASCMASEGVIQDKTDLMIQKAVSKANELGIKISVAVVDAHGNLKAFKPELWVFLSFGLA